MFASADGTGVLDLWNLNEDTEVPIVKTNVTNRALSRVTWHKDGKKILTGDSAGYLYLYDTTQVGLANPEEWRKMEETLNKIKLTQQEEQQ